MEGRGEIPLVVWTWTGHQIVLLWGEYALDIMRKAAQNVLPSAPANNRPSASGMFEILVFQKSLDKWDQLAYGGMPVLCFNVLSTSLPSSDVISTMMDHYLQMHVYPTIWAFNAHVPCPSKSGIEVKTVKEGEIYHHHLEALFGRSNVDQWDQIVHDTSTLPVEVDANFLFESDDDDHFF